MTLDKGLKNSLYIIEKTNLPQNLEKRLEALGMTVGTQVTVLANKNAGTLIVKVRGTRFAMGRNISKNIVVNEANEAQGKE